jgi:Flp pilus assembly protein TadB
MPEVRQKRQRRRPSGPPESGWAFGAGVPPKAFWATLAVLLLILAVYLLAVNYIGYGAVILLLAAAAAVNLW